LIAGGYIKNTRPIGGTRRQGTQRVGASASPVELVDSNIIGIFIWDFDGRVLEANDEFLRMLNYDREESAQTSSNEKTLSSRSVRRRLFWSLGAASSCAYRKSNPGILVVQSAQDRATENASNFLGGA
jgi:PAS fold